MPGDKAPPQPRITTGEGRAEPSFGKNRGKPRPRIYDDAHGNRFGRSKQHEHRIADELGGRRVARSGGMPWSSYDEKNREGKTLTNGGDIKTPELMVEHKRTDMQSMSLKREWLDGVKQGAKMALRDPAIVITFEDNLSERPPEDWIMVPLAVWKRRAAKEGEDVG